MAKLVATSIVTGNEQDQGHGAVYLVDLDGEKSYRPLDCSADEHPRGLRGIAIHRDRVFMAASDALIEFNPNFEKIASYRNPNLQRCREICVHGHHVFIVSAEFDSIVAFNLRKNAFDLAFMLQTDGQSVSLARFDPAGDDGPLPMNKFELNSVYCEQGGMYIAGQKTNGLLLYNGKRIGVSTTLPAGAHNARPHRDGIIFNDTEGQAVRYATQAGAADCAFSVPGRLGRGLCPVGERRIAAGSAPATISLYDLDEKTPVTSASVSTNDQDTIHSIAVWPFY